VRSASLTALSAGLASLGIAGCAMLGTASPLFPTRASVQRFDFERDTLHQPPEGFDAHGGQWSVVDSPTATSGTQVLVRGDDSAGLLAVKEAEGVTAAGGEVQVRVFLGSSGAGLSCSSSKNGGGHVLKLEANATRVALYREADGSMKMVDEYPAPVPKGEWARIGIRCDSDRVIGYLDGKPVVRDRSTTSAFDLALYADAGVTAQFDDLSYWANK